MAYTAATPSSSIYQEVVSTFGNLNEPRGIGQENRSQARVNVEGRTTVIPCSGPDARKPLSALVRDASPSGIGIVLNRSFRVGDKFVVVLSRAHSVLCEVMNWNPIDADRFRIGGRFIAELRQDEREKPAAPAAPATPKQPTAAAPPSGAVLAPAPQLSPVDIAKALKSAPSEPPDLTPDGEEVRQLEARLAKLLL